MTTAEESLYGYLEQFDPTPSDEQIQEAAELDNDESSEAGPTWAQEWAVTDESSADWALRKIAGAEAEEADVLRVFEEQFEQLKKWRDGELARLDRRVNFFSMKLEDYAQAAIDLSGKSKSKKLPHGTIGFRSQPPKIDRDDVRLLAEAKANGLPIKELPDWAGIKAQLDLKSGVAVVKETGVVLESVTVEERPDAFYVKAGGR